MKTSPFFIQWWKELRAVLPVWGAVMLGFWLCSISSLFGNDRPVWQVVIFVAGSALVCTLVYTREFQDRTLIWQFLQPVNRMSVLGRKFAAAVVLQGLFGALFLSVASMDGAAPWFLLWFTGVVSLLAVTSCCFWGVWIRNVLSALVVSTLVAFLLSLVFSLPIEVIAEKSWLDSPEFDRGAFIAKALLGAMAVYAVVSAGAAVLLWRRLQLAGDATPVSSLDVGVTSRFLGDRSVCRLPAWLALVRKELGLLRYMFWITGIFLIAAALFMAVDGVLDHMITAARSELSPGDYLPLDRGVIWWQSGLRGVATALFVIQLALVPTLCGALAFTEEAYLGNRAWQLCQPVHWLRQCLIKFTTGLGISIVSGLVIPSIVAIVYASVGAGQLIKPDLDLVDVTQAVTFHFVLFGVAAWCATWSRTSVTTVVKAFLVILCFFTLTAYLAVLSIRTVHSPDWRIAAWALTLLAIISTFFNFRFPEMPARRWLGQGTLAILLLVATFFLFRA